MTTAAHHTLPLATRISKEIADQLRHDGEVDERWMADWIEQEAILPFLEALEETECACCNHLLKYHVSKYGCEVERGDAWVTGNQASAPTVLVAQGPCGCNACYVPPLDPVTFAQELRAIAAIRLAKGEQS